MVKFKFVTSPGNPFVTSCVSDAQNCGKMQILDLAELYPFVTSFVSDAQTLVKWAFLTGLDRTTADFVVERSTGVALCSTE